MMCKQNCFLCARREKFVCYGLYAFDKDREKKHMGINMKIHTEGTEHRIMIENDLKKVGQQCIMFKPKAWSIS